MICPACGHMGNLPGADECEKCLFPLSALDGPSPFDQVELSLLNEPVSILLPKSPVTVSHEATLGQAMAIMHKEHVGAVLVVNVEKELVGILTERDFLTKVAGTTGFENRPVAEFMTSKLETVKQNDPLAFALSKMASGGYRHLPVMDENRPVGVISVRDCLRHIVELCKD